MAKFFVISHRERNYRKRFTAEEYADLDSWKAGVAAKIEPLNNVVTIEYEDQETNMILFVDSNEEFEAIIAPSIRQQEPLRMPRFYVNRSMNEASNTEENEQKEDKIKKVYMEHMAQHHLEQLTSLSYKGKTDFFHFYDQLVNVIKRSSMPKTIIVEYMMNGQQVFEGNARKCLETHRNRILAMESTVTERKQWLLKEPELLSIQMDGDHTQQDMDAVNDTPIDISDIQLSRIIGVIVTHFAQKNHIAEKQLAVQNTRQMKTESIAEFLNGFKQRLKAIEIEINYRNRNGVIVSPMPEYQVVDALLVNLQDLIYNYVMKRKFELYQNLAITLEQTEGILHECQRFTQGLDGQGSRKRRHKPRATHTSINALHQVYDDEENCCANKRQFIDANLRQNTQFDDAKWREDRVSNHPLEYEPNIAATSVVQHKQKTKRPCKWGTKELCKLSNERTTCYFAHQTLEKYRKELLRTAKKACKWTNTNCNWLKDGCCKYKHEEEICVLGIVCNESHCQKNHIIRPNPRNMKMPQMKNAIRWKKQSANQYDKSEPSQPQTLSLTQQKRFNPKTHREVGSHGVAKVDVDDDFAPPSTNIAAELAALQRFHIMAVSTLNKSTEWNDNDGKAEELIHKVFTDSFDPKLTYNMTIWKSDYAIKTFVDGGADINIIGQEVASKLLGIPHVIAATGQCINIYAVDRNVQHKISDRIIVSMNKKKWNEDNGRMILIRTEIIFYVTPFIDKNMILLGRSGCKRMNLKTFNTEELKEYHYYVKHNKEFSILPNGEDENCVFDALALRGTGPPGLYLYDKKNNTITAIQTVKDVAKYKENKISTIKSWAKATDTATNTTAEAIDVDINMMRTTIEPINGTKTIEDAHKQEQLSLNGAANAMNTVTSDNKESKDAKAHRNDLDAIDAMNTVTSNDNQVQNIFKKAFVKKKKIKRRILRSADESVNNNAQLSEAIDQIKVSDRFDVVTTHALGSKDKLEEDSINNAKNGDDENTQFHTENDIKWTKNAQISETIDETNGNVVIVSPTHDESPSLVSPYDETNEIEFETDRDTHNLANKSLTQHGHAALSASLLSHNPTRAIVRILKPVSSQQSECIKSNDETNNAKVNDTEIESSVSNQQSDTQIEIESKAMNTIQMEEDSKSNDKASNCGMSSEATQQLNEMASIDLERLHCNNYVYNANVAAFKKPNDDMNLELDANSIDDTLTEWAFNTILIEFEQLYDDDHEDEPQLDAHNEDEPNVMHTMDMEEDEESSDESSSCLLDVELNAMHTMETKEDEDSSDESSSCELPPERECLLKQQTNEILRLQRINYVETSKRKHRHNKRKQLKELNKETVRHRLASISEIDTNQKDGEQTANIASEVADIAFDIDAVEEDKKKKRYAPILQDDEIDGREAKGLGSRVRSIQEHDQQQTKQQIIASITFGKEVTEEDKQYFISQLDKFDLWNVFSGHKWDVNTLDIPPFDIKIKDPSKNRLLPYYKLSEFDQTIASNEIKQWILRKIGRFATIQDEVHHASPGFVAHRRYAIEDDGMILVKSRIATDYILINDNTYEYNAGSIDTCAEVQNKIAQHLFINSTDATKYYYSIPITPAARAVSACSLKEGIFLFNVLPTGLKNASRYGAEITKRIFNDVGTATVMDDIYNGGVSVRKAIDNFIGLLQKANKSKVKLAAHKTIA
eukprot:559263_1